MLKNLEMLSIESSEIRTNSKHERNSDSEVSTIIQAQGQKIIEDQMRKYIKFEVPEDIENCEDLIIGLRKKRLSIEEEMLDQMKFNKRASYDVVRQQNEVRRETENRTKNNSLVESIRESMNVKGVSKSADRTSLNISS